MWTSQPVKSSLLLALVIVLAACGKPQSRNADVITTPVSPDVSQSTLKAEAIEKFLREKKERGVNEDCAKQIEAIACVSESEEQGFDAECSKEKVRPEWLKSLSALREQLPSIHRKVFCQLDRLQIHMKMPSIGYASQVFDSAFTPVGNMIGVRPSALERKDDAYDIISWKEQLSFGLSNRVDPKFAVSEKGPRVVLHADPESARSILLTYVLTHELSHVIDFMNRVTREPSCKEASGKRVCEIEPGTFATLTWPSPYTQVANTRDGVSSDDRVQAFHSVSELCFYNCAKTARIEDIAKIYSDLAETSFMTSYSSASMYEDFAEASAFLLLKDSGLQYKVIGPNGDVLFDLDQQLEKPLLKAKKAWLKEFYGREDIVTAVKLSGRN